MAAVYKRNQDHNIMQLMWPTLEKLPLDHEVRVLSLPASTWEFEQVLAKTYSNRKFVFLGWRVVRRCTSACVRMPGCWTDSSPTPGL